MPVHLNRVRVGEHLKPLTLLPRQSGDVNDYAYEIPQAEDLYRRYVNDEVVAVMGWGTGDTEALRTRVANDELPFISGSFSEELTDVEESPYNFLIAPTYSDQIRVALNHIDQETDGEARVAVLHNDSPSGTSPVGDGSDWVEEQGLEKQAATRMKSSVMCRVGTPCTLWQKVFVTR